MNIRPAFLTVLVLCLPLPTPAPVPRCSPILLLNKVLDFSNIWSDANPTFPVPPCEYGGPLEALLAGDLKAFGPAPPINEIPLHTFYETIWFFKTGLPRIIRVLMGQERYVEDTRILNEGYKQHYTAPNVRQNQFGHGTRRRPEIIDNKDIYWRVMSGKLKSLFRDGPDRVPTNYTPQGPLRRRSRVPKKKQKYPLLKKKSGSSTKSKKSLLARLMSG